MDLSEASSSETLRSHSSPEQSNMTNDTPKANSGEKPDNSEDTPNSEATALSEAEPESEQIPHSEASPLSENESPRSPEPTYDDEVSSSTGNIAAENTTAVTENSNQRHGPDIGHERKNPQSQAGISKIYPGLMNLLSRSDDTKLIEDCYDVSRVHGINSIPSLMNPSPPDQSADHTHSAQNKSGLDVLVPNDRWKHTDLGDKKESSTEVAASNSLKRKFPDELMIPHKSVFINCGENLTSKTLRTCSSFLDKSSSLKTSMDKPDCTNSDIECLDDKERTPTKLTNTELDQTGNGLVSKSHQSAIKKENFSDSKKVEMQSSLTLRDIFDITNSSDEDK